MDKKAEQSKTDLEKVKQKTDNPKVKEAIDKKLQYFNKPVCK